MQERFADLAPSPSQAPHPDVLDPEQNQESDWVPVPASDAVPGCRRSRIGSQTL